MAETEKASQNGFYAEGMKDTKDCDRRLPRSLDSCRFPHLHLPEHPLFFVLNKEFSTAPIPFKPVRYTGTDLKLELSNLFHL